jgi:hypothetical protein
LNAVAGTSNQSEDFTQAFLCGFSLLNKMSIAQSESILKCRSFEKKSGMRLSGVVPALKSGDSRMDAVLGAEQGVAAQEILLRK